MQSPAEPAPDPNPPQPSLRQTLTPIRPPCVRAQTELAAMQAELAGSLEEVQKRVDAALRAMEAR
jgi:hypothetical protein